MQLNAVSSTVLIPVCKPWTSSVIGLRLSDNTQMSAWALGMSRAIQLINHLSGATVGYGEVL